MGASLIYGTTGPLELRARRDGDVRRPDDASSFRRARGALPLVARDHHRRSSSSGRASASPSTSILWRPLRRRGRRHRPAHDREHRPLARAALHVPVLSIGGARVAAARARERRRRTSARSDLGVVDIDRISMGVIDRRDPARSPICLLRTRIGRATQRHLRQPAARRGIGHQRRRASSGSSGSSRAALAGARRHPLGVLPAWASAGTWAPRCCCSSSPPSPSAGWDGLRRPRRLAHRGNRRRDLDAVDPVRPEVRRRPRGPDPRSCSFRPSGPPGS